MVKNSDKSIRAIGDEMKALEARLETRLPLEGYVIIRVDGRAFHTLTRHMEEPFDRSFVDAMNAAAANVLEAVDAEFVYVQSDEITAVLSPYGRKANVLPFDGRLEKLVTIAASAAASGFTKALMMSVLDGALAAGHADSGVAAHVPAASFDARAIHVEDLTGVADNLLWRRVDCRKNAVSAVARTEFSDGELHGKSTGERWQMLADKHDGGFKIDDCLYWGRLLSTGDVPANREGRALSSGRGRGIRVLPATKENTECVLSRLEAREQGSPSA